jgi:hypothetical protein
LTVWFEDPEEARSLWQEGKPFVVALAKRRQIGKASSDDIYRVLDVEPTGKEPETIARSNPLRGVKAGLLCRVIGDSAPLKSAA